MVKLQYKYAIIINTIQHYIYLCATIFYKSNKLDIKHVTFVEFVRVRLSIILIHR